MRQPTGNPESRVLGSNRSNQIVKLDRRLGDFSLQIRVIRKRDRLVDRVDILHICFDELDLPRFVARNESQRHTQTAKLDGSGSAGRQ